MLRKLWVIPLLAIFCLASGCAKLTLKHTPLTPSAQPTAPVKLVVINSRTEDLGGADEFVVGRLRNLYGMPIKFKAENSMVEAVRSLFADALRNSGYAVDENGPVQVEVDIKTFFMDGYMGYKIDAGFEVRVVSGGAVAYVAPISATHGFAFMRNSDMYAAYDVLMDKIAQGAIEAMGKEGFKNAVVSPASAAPAPPPEGEAAPAPSPETPAAPTAAPQPTT